MVTIVLSVVLFLIFLILGGFHFYWLFGGEWGLKKVIPTKGDSINTNAIPKFATFIVAVVLTVFGFLYALKPGWIAFTLPNWITNYGYWFIPSIFILRAIGDFNYVGFFKKVKNTEFAKADSKIFAPLCICIGIIGFLLQFI